MALVSTDHSGAPSGITTAAPSGVTTCPSGPAEDGRAAPLWWSSSLASTPIARTTGPIRLCGHRRADRASYTTHLNPRAHKPPVPMIALTEHRFVAFMPTPKLRRELAVIAGRLRRAARKARHNPTAGSKRWGRRVAPRRPRRRALGVLLPTHHSGGAWRTESRSSRRDRVSALQGQEYTLPAGNVLARGAAAATLSVISQLLASFGVLCVGCLVVCRCSCSGAGRPR